MENMKRWLVIFLLILGVLPLAACSGSDLVVAKEEPAMVEAIAGSEFNKITLTERAAQRLGIQSGAIREETIDGRSETVVPYSAIIYGLHGETWVYTLADDSGLAYTRAPVTIERIEGDLAILTDGPGVETEVVTIAVAELYGVDTGVGK